MCNHSLYQNDDGSIECLEPDCQFELSASDVLITIEAAIKSGLTQRAPDAATLFGMRVELANWLKPNQWFIRPSRHR